MSKLFNLDIDYSKRVYGLDIVRATAIIMVVFWHSYHIISDYIPETINKVFSVIGNGFDGVDLFFVLSGFLIGTILLKIIYKNRQFNFSLLVNFWKRRWYRTLPNYYLILILNILLALILGTEISFSSTIRYFFFLQNFDYPHPSFFVEAWSLSVEEWFYLLTPLLILFFFAVFKNKLKLNTIFIISICTVFSVSLFFRFYNAFHLVGGNDIWEAWFRKPVVGRLESILFGVLGAFFQLNYPHIWNANIKRKFYIGISLILISFLMAFALKGTFQVFYKQTLHFTVTSFGILLLMPFFSNIKTCKTRVGAMITSISLISYSLYLVNYTLMFSIITLFPYKASLGVALLSFILYWSTCIIISMIMYKYFEKPILDYRNLKVKQ